MFIYKIKTKYLENIEHFLLSYVVVAIEIIETEGPLEFVVDGATRGRADGAQELPGQRNAKLSNIYMHTFSYKWIRRIFFQIELPVAKMGPYRFQDMMLSGFWAGNTFWKTNIWRKKISQLFEIIMPINASTK